MGLKNFFKGRKLFLVRVDNSYKKEFAPFKEFFTFSEYIKCAYVLLWHYGASQCDRGDVKYLKLE